VAGDSSGSVGGGGTGVRGVAGNTKGRGALESDSVSGVIFRSVHANSDGFTFIVINGQVAAALAAAGATPAGLHALDMARMELGEPRPGVTPVSASMVSMLDRSKMRLHTLFAWKEIFPQLARGPTYRSCLSRGCGYHRVGVVVAGYFSRQGLPKN
jgi:hypothetical protein